LKKGGTVNNCEEGGVLKKERRVGRFGWGRSSGHACSKGAGKANVERDRLVIEGRKRKTSAFEKKGRSAGGKTVGTDSGGGGRRGTAPGEAKEDSKVLSGGGGDAK